MLREYHNVQTRKQMYNLCPPITKKLSQRKETKWRRVKLVNWPSEGGANGPAGRLIRTKVGCGAGVRWRRDLAACGAGRRAWRSVTCPRIAARPTEGKCWS